MDLIISIHRDAPVEIRAVDNALLKLEYCRWVLLERANKKHGQEAKMVRFLDGLVRAENFIKVAREDNAFHSDPVWEGDDRDADARRALVYTCRAIVAYKRAIRWCSRRRVREAARYFQD